jgi:hypothetical protein
MLGGLEVELEKAPEEVGVATFQPLNWMAEIQVEDWTASVVLFTPVVKEARYVMVWPGIKGDVHVPTALPGSPFWRSYPLESWISFKFYTTNLEVIAYEGQHNTRVLDPDWTDVAAVVNAAGHTIGRMLRLVKPSPPWWSCSHHVVAAGGRQRGVPPKKYPYPGSQATGAGCPGKRKNDDAQPDEEGQGVVTGIQEVVVPELTSGMLYTMLVAAAVVDIVPQNGVEEKRDSNDVALI